MDIVMTGFAGCSGAKALVNEHYPLLRRTLSDAFLSATLALQVNVADLPADYADLPHVQTSSPRKVADGSVIPAMTLAVPVEEGGVFEALWKLADMAQLGLNADLSAIPIRQHTIEVCEILDVNPYQIPAGCLLYLADNGNGCPGKVIGQTNRSKGKTITGAEGIRYLDKPRHR